MAEAAGGFAWERKKNNISFKSSLKLCSTYEILCSLYCYSLNKLYYNSKFTYCNYLCFAVIETDVSIRIPLGNLNFRIR